LKIKKLHIRNFKSIADLEIIEPNPFTVFVGPNGSGKSNIFEALEYTTLTWKFPSDDKFVRSIFGDTKSFLSIPQKNSIFDDTTIQFQKFKASPGMLNTGLRAYTDGKPYNYEMDSDFRQFVKNISVIFPNNFKRERFKIIDDNFLSLSCSNLENVLKRILNDEYKKDELFEWLELFIPEFEKVEIYSDSINGQNTLLISEKYSSKPFNKSLISDGTYNILALLTAVFQSDEPQFLCIEEPENGLTPDVIKEMVTLFRNACEEKGHYIWLNTHSQSLVSQLTADEIITVNKIKGETKIKQFKGKDFHGLRMDEAWLTNTLGGGLPW
jgi:predicted ATPase